MSSDTEKLIDGKRVAETIFSEVAAGSADFSKHRRQPFLAVVIAGEDPASQAYVKSKVTAAVRCGIGSTLIELAATVEAAYLLDRIARLNADPGVDGILVQMPLPPHIDQQQVIESISTSISRPLLRFRMQRQTNFRLSQQLDRQLQKASCVSSVRGTIETSSRN
jgi:hypothetical protein